LTCRERQQDSEREDGFSLKLLRGHAKTAIQKTLSDHKIDVIMGPADARMASVAASAGYPIATVPLGFAELNGRAFGVNVLVTSGSEGKMLKIMSAWRLPVPQA
jgi:amidase